MDKLYIVMPTYNEEANIEKVIEDWYTVIDKCSEDSRLVIVNDGSKDSTYEKMCELKHKYPKFVPITKDNEGHGATVLYAYNYALENGADFIFQTDSDGQTCPDEFWKFWDQRNDYAMVIGHRKYRQDGFSRVVVTKTLKFVLFLCFHVMIKDANTPFRLLNANILKENIGFIPAKHNLSNVLLSVIYAKKKMPVKYETITFKPRQGGVNSINIPKIIKIGFKALKDFCSLNKKINKSIVSN